MTSAASLAPAREIKWSPQQQDFINWAVNGSGSCVLEAVAGSGKTTTILGAATQMKGKIAILAYNKKIAEEIQVKVAGHQHIKAGTVHSFGFSAFRNTFEDRSKGKSIKVDGRKVSDIVDHIDQSKLGGHAIAVVKLVALAKQYAFGVLGSIEDDSRWFEIANHFDVFATEKGEGQMPEAEIVKTAKEVLKKSNSMTNIIDFDDMVYLPTLLNCRFWKYDVLMVDEAQDTNPARRALIRAMVKEGGRMFAIGDSRQAIYGFGGCDHNSLDLIGEDFNAIKLPLTTTYRCPKAVVAFAKNWVSHIEAHESAPEGSVSTTTLGEFFKRNDLNGEAAVLCRLTAPLIKLALQLIRNRIPCRVEGRDIGANIKKLVLRWKVASTAHLREKLEVWVEREKNKAMAKKMETKAQQVDDMYQTALVIIEECERAGQTTINGVANSIDTLFGDDVKGMLVLSTIHKSKGREWERVFWLDRANTCPSKWARQDWQRVQEANLCYVAATRAKDQLIEVILPPKISSRGG